MKVTKVLKERRVKVGARLKFLRLRGKLSQLQLATKVGVCNSTISNWEKGKSAIYGRHLVKLSEIYNVTIDYILLLSDDECKTSKGRVIIEKNQH